MVGRLQLTLVLSAAAIVLAPAAHVAAQDGGRFRVIIPYFTPLGDGNLCIDPTSPGLFRLIPAVKTDAAGNASRLLDFNAKPLGSGAGMVTAFSTWNFQFWFRDPSGGPSGSNTSDALELTFCP